MSIVGACVLLGLLVALMVRQRMVGPVAGLVCVLFGLVLGASPVGGQVNAGVTQLGRWVAVQVGGL